MGYRQEFASGWRPLLGAAMGIGGGIALTFYVSSLFLPHLSRAFGWTEAQFALVGIVALAATVGVILSGWAADRFGARRVALVGIIGMPLVWLGFSQLQGNIVHYYALFTLLMALGATTTSVVYSRVVVQRFFAARGFALAVAIAGAPAVGALAAPAVSAVIDAEGWRMGYVAVAALSALLGIGAFLVLPRGAGEGVNAITPTLMSPRPVYAAIVRAPQTWALFGAMLACNLPALMISLQLKPMLVATGHAAEWAAPLVSIYAVGVMAGRFGCGLALDRWPAHRVAAAAMLLPAFGLLALAFGGPGFVLAAAALALIGVSQGAEGDIAAYLVARHYGFAIYGTVFGLVTAAIGLSAALGGGVLSLILANGGGYPTFLMICAASVAGGAMLFLLLGRRAYADPVTVEPQITPRPTASAQA
jgi:MFS family permease